MAALGPFKKQLKAALMGAMKDGGPTAAIHVCSSVAPALAKSASTDKVTVGRSSSRLRNPDNAAQPWLAPVLEEMNKLDDPAGATRTVELPDGRVGYAEAILVAEPCLACHGEQVSDEVAALLQQKYPDDRATGYSAGDLRGVFYAIVTP